MSAPDRETIVADLHRLAAGEAVVIRGPVAIDLHDFHEWATGVQVEPGGEQGVLSWHGGHHHVNRIAGPVTMVGDSLHIPTEEHGVIVVRPIGPEDTWGVVPGNLTAWEAFQQGLT